MLKLLVVSMFVAFGLAMIATTQAADAKSPLDFKMKGIDGKEVDLSKYKGKVVLIVNVASKCGLTPQYEGLEALYEKYNDQGLVVLGFPANEFGHQEPGTDAEIARFCSATYDVKFPMFSKIVVKGEAIHPLYKFLTSTDTNPKFAKEVKWNFEKFLVNRNGDVVARFASTVTPQTPEVVKAIEAELEKK